MAKHYFVVVGEIVNGSPEFSIDHGTTDNKFDGRPIWDEGLPDTYVDGVMGEWVTADSDHREDDHIIAKSLRDTLGIE